MLLSFITVTSCNDNDDDALGYMGEPQITLISPAVDENGNKISPLQNTNIGFGGNVYIIEGKGFKSLKHIYFNDVETYFNPNMVTDTHIVLTINQNTPYGPNESKKLKLVSGFGTTEHDFIIAPPKPVFKSFHPVNAEDGETITIYGNFFVDPTVKVGDTPAEIESYEVNRIKVKLPQGSQGKKLSVTTLSGTSTWGTAVGTAIFDDAFHAPWDIESWNNHFMITDESKAAQGEVFYGKKMGGWDNIQSNWPWGVDDPPKKYTGIKFSVRSDGAGKLKFIFNGDWSEKFLLNTTSDWVEHKYTWKDLGYPQALQNISFQEFTGTETTYYFDNITYTVD